MLICVLARTRAALAERGIGFFDLWYLDDGLLVCAPACADILLRMVDVDVAHAGASRETGNFAKSVARLVGTPAAVGATQAG